MAGKKPEITAEKAYNDLLDEIKRLNLGLLINKDVFLANFKEKLNEERTGEILYHYLMKQLGEFKQKAEANEQPLRCPNCDNILFMTGYMRWHEYTGEIAFSCTNCGKSYKYHGSGWDPPSKSEELEEVQHPDFIRIQE